MATKRDDGTYVCDCGEEFDSSNSINGHGKWCDEYTTLMVERICQGCGKDFRIEPWRVAQGKGKYCSKECAGHSKRDRVTKTCKECGEDFSIHPYEVERGGGKYCSVKCRGISERKQVSHVCQECGDTFKVKKYRAEKEVVKYCSVGCKANAQKDRIEKTCNECGDTFKVTPFDVEQGCDKHCSMECYAESRRLPESARGPWEYGPLWEEKREKARKRDDKKCQDCGMTDEKHIDEVGRELSVHHIEKYRTFDKDENAHRLDNLVTLCCTCHAKWEAKEEKFPLAERLK